MKKLIEQLCQLLNDGQDLVLVTLSGQTGSTPRLAGAKMVVERSGRIHGTIGGGLIEAKAIEEATACFSRRGLLCISYDLSNSAAAVADMICGGRMELFFEHIEATLENRRLFAELHQALAAGRRSWLISRLDQEAPRRWLLDARGDVAGSQLPEGVTAAVRAQQNNGSCSGLVEVQGHRYLCSAFSRASHLYLIGAGHVSACTAEAAARVGFRITVLDDRPEFANQDRFPLADRICVLDDFSDCFKGQCIDRDSFLVIVTRGHLHDLEVLEQALQTQAGYIGMIGSRRKRNTLYARLLDKGVSEAQLEQVRCPIGLAIEADTPEEIAISIVGELIYQRATGRRPWHLS